MDDNKIQITVELDSKKAEQQADKLNDKLVDGAKDANKEFKKYTDSVNKNLNNIQNQMNKTFDGVKLGNKLTSGLNGALNKIKTQISNALGNINVKANANINSTTSSNNSNNNGGQGVSAMGASLITGGAMGASLAKSLSVAREFKGVIGDTFKTLTNPKFKVGKKNFDLDTIVNSIENVQQKMTNFSGGVKHSFNDAINFINGCFREAQEELNKTEVDVNSLEFALTSTKQGLDFLFGESVLSKKDLKNFETMELFISQIESKLQELRGKGIDIVDGKEYEQLARMVNELTVATQGFGKFKLNAREAFLTVKDVANNALDKLGNKLPKLANNLKNFGSGISKGLSSAIPYIDRMKNKITEWANKHKQATDKVKNANKSVGSSFKSLLQQVLPFASIYGIFNGLKTSITSYVDSLSNANKFATVFKGETQQMAEWVDELSSRVTMGKSEIMDFSSNLYRMGLNMGVAKEDAMSMSQSMTELGADLKAFTGDANAIEALAGALRGEYDSIQNYGYALDASSVKAKALAMGLDSASESALLLARQTLLLEQSGDVLGYTARNSQSLAVQLAFLRNNFIALGNSIASCFAGLLQVVLPVLNRIVQAVTQAFSKLASLINGIFGVFGIKVGGFGGGGSTGGGAKGAIADAVGGIGDALSDGLNGATGGADKVADALDKGASSAKEIQKYMLGIDELNVVKGKDGSGSGSGSGNGSGSSSEGSGGGGLGSGGIGDNGIGGFDTSGYEDSSKEVQLVISDLARKIGNALKAVWDTFKRGWDSVSDYIKQGIENLKQAFINLGTAIENFLVGVWNNGGEELIYNFGRLAGAITGAMLDVGSQAVNAVAKLFAYLNPESNPYTRAFLNGLNNLLVACQNFALSVGGWFRTFLDNGGQAFFNVIGDIVMILGTTLANTLANVINWITLFMESWAGQTLIKACALALDVLAGAVKVVAIVVEKLTPLWSALLIAWGAYSTYKTVSSLLTKMGKVIVDVGLAIASNLEATLLWIKNGLSKLVTALGKAMTSALNFAKSLVTSVVSAIWSASGSIASYVVGLFGMATAEGVATTATTALQIALSALGIGLIIGAIVGLIAVIKNWSTISKKISDLWQKFMDFLGEKCPWLKGIFEGLGKVFSWIGEKVGWLWNKIKGFFGWSGDNSPKEMTEETDLAVEGLGDTVEETSDRFGSACSAMNESLASLEIDSTKLALALDKAEQTFDEKFSMMSKNAKDYLDALATGNEEVLQKMSADSGTYTEEIKYAYEKMSEEEKALFYSTYGEIEGITDSWMNYTGLSYDQMALRHASYVQNIINNENISAQEKDRLIEEANANFKSSLDTQLADLKSQLAEIDSMEGISNTERIAMKQDLKDQIQALEQGMANDSINSINSVEDAVKTSADTQTQSYDGVSTAQQEALKGVDSSLEETKGNLSSFKEESDKVASEIPKAWSGIGKTISTEFNLAKQDVVKAFNDMIASIRNQSTVLKTTLSTAFKGITNDARVNTTNMAKNVTNAFKSMASSIKQQLTSLSSSIKTSFQQIGSNINASFSDISNKLVATLNNMKTQANNALNSIKNTFNNSLDSIKNSSQNKMTQICSGMVQKLNQSKTDITNAFKGIGNSIGSSLDSLNNQIRNKMNTVVASVQDGVRRMKNATNFNFPTPYMKMPHIQVYGNWNFEKKTVPSFRVQWWSSGAIFSKPTILNGMGVGDASSGMGSQMEAVIPISKLWNELGKQFTKQNQTLNKGNNQPVNITFKIDSREIGKATFKSFEEMSRLGIIDLSTLI